jgi:peroxiredoxin
VLIDPDGIVRKIYEVTDVAGHPAEVLADIVSFGMMSG